MIFVYIITLVLLAAYAVLLNYYLKGWKSQPESGSPPSGYPASTFITVLVPARNEQQQIRNCLDSLLAQDYPKHLREFIIIDDHSEDQTAAIVKEYENQGVRLLSLNEYLPAGQQNSYKKKAIETGISQSRGSLILTTDADCTAGPGWLKAIAYCHEQTGAQLVAAPVKIPFQRTWLSVFQSLDFLSLQGITAASVFLGFHSMCNGANLAYTTHAFKAVKGFEGIDGLASGDDMLLMHKIARDFPHQIVYLKNRDAIVNTLPTASLKDFLQQRIRWASKARFYDDKNVLVVLMLVYLLNIALLVCMAAAFFSGNHALAAIGLILLKTLAEYRFMRSVAEFYGQSAIMQYFVFLQPFHIVYTVLAGTFGQFGQYEWKGRKVR